MSDIEDIAAALAARHHGSLMLEEEKKTPPPPRPVREYDTGGRSTHVYVPPAPSSGAPKIFPSDRMALRNGPSKADVRPKRAGVMIASYSDSDLEWMLNTPVKRGWSFPDWLEVIGLPRDLHEKHDVSVYGYAARAFLQLKDNAHRK